jgi:hypothetical protein
MSYEDESQGESTEEWPQEYDQQQDYDQQTSDQQTDDQQTVDQGDDTGTSTPDQPDWDPSSDPDPNAPGMVDTWYLLCGNHNLGVGCQGKNRSTYEKAKADMDKHLKLHPGCEGKCDVLTAPGIPDDSADNGDPCK